MIADKVAGLKVINQGLKLRLKVSISFDKSSESIFEFVGEENLKLGSVLRHQCHPKVQRWMNFTFADLLERGAEAL